MAKRSSCSWKDSGCQQRAILTLWVLHVAVFIALVVFINWNYCHQKGKGPCQKDGNDYISSNVTSAQKQKCQKYESGIVHT